MRQHISGLEISLREFPAEEYFELDEQLQAAVWLVANFIWKFADDTSIYIELSPNYTFLHEKGSYCIARSDAADLEKIEPVDIYQLPSEIQRMFVHACIVEEEKQPSRLEVV